MVCVCECGTCVAVQGGGGCTALGTHGSACANCASTRVHALTPNPAPLPAALLTSPGCRGKGGARTCALTHTHTHTKTPPHTPPQPHSPPLCAQTGPKVHFQGWKHWRLVGGGGRGDTGTHAGGRGDTGGAVPTPHCRGSVGLVTAEPLSFSVPLREGTKVPRGGSLTWERGHGDMGI